jgi:hypothetical protein
MSFSRRQPFANPTAGFAFAKPTREPKEPSYPHWKPPGRVASDVVFRPYVDWLHADGAFCVVCGTEITERIQGAHVGQGGTGKKHGSAADMIRLCGDRPGKRGCHSQHDANGTMEGFFHLWSRARLRAWDREQRLAHWDAFRDFAGMVTRVGIVAAGVKGTIYQWIECDAAIAECVRALLTGERS